MRFFFRVYINAILVSFCIRVSVLLNLLNPFGKSIRCSTKPRILHLSFSFYSILLCTSTYTYIMKDPLYQTLNIEYNLNIHI